LPAPVAPRAGGVRGRRRQDDDPAHQALLDDPEFQKGDYTIKWLEQWLARQGDPA